MATKKNDKKPIVNWLSRKKEVSYSDSTDAKGKNYKIKTKVVTAPESRTSKPMEKKVTKVTTKREGGNMLPGVVAGLGLGIAGSLTKNDAMSNRLTAAGVAAPIANAVANKMSKTKTVSKTKTKKK